MKSSVIILNSTLFGFNAGIFHIEKISAFVRYWGRKPTKKKKRKLEYKEHPQFKFILYLCFKSSLSVHSNFSLMFSICAFWQHKKSESVIIQKYPLS